jgi:hypothetical protein
MTTTRVERSWKWLRKYLTGKAIYWFILLASGIVVVYLRHTTMFRDKPTPSDIGVLGVFVILLLVPLFDEISIFGVSVKRRVDLLEKSVEKVESLILRGEVVRDEQGRRFYIGKDGIRHLIPDDETAQLLQSQRGEISVSTGALEAYKQGDQMESVLRCKLVRDSRWTIFAILREKEKYYISSWGPLIDWGRDENEIEQLSQEVLRSYRTER